MQRKSTRIKPPEVAHLKPDKFKNYLTLGELAMVVGRDRDYIRKLEREGALPTAARVKVSGLLTIRLYSPTMVEEIKRIFANRKPGRPRKG